MRSGREVGVSGESGYNLVALMVLVAVINIGFAAALPSVSQAIKREKEAELVFRGLQYAEAIRVFQQRTGRYPVSLRELLENNPRCIRQLWTDPFSDTGDWGLILADGATGRSQVAGGTAPGEDEQERASRRRRRPRRGRQDAEELTPRENVLEENRGRAPRAGQVVTRGPVIGVRSLSGGEGARTFMGSQSYSEWLFTVDLIPTLAAPVVGENVPRLHAEWIGRAFPEGLEPTDGTAPDESLSNPLDRRGGQGTGSGSERRSRRRPRRSSSDG